jgi:hypothetical protein
MRSLRFIGSIGASALLALSLLVGITGPAQVTTTAITCGQPDDTPAANAAAAAGGYVQLPLGVCNIAAGINGTNTFGFVVTGYGPNSVLNGIQTGAPIVDLTGASHPTVSNLRITTNYGIQSQVGILNAQTKGSYSSDATRIQNVRIDGTYQIAAHYDLGVASSGVEFSQFYNYTPGGFTSIHTSNNSWGAHSLYTTIDDANDKPPSDWTFVQVENHDLGIVNGVAGTSVWLGAVGNFRWIGGNVSSSGTRVTINATPNPHAPGTAMYPINVSFHGTTFYSDYAPSPAIDVYNNAGASGQPKFSGYTTNPSVSP